MRKHSGIPIGVDDSDHIAFFCPDCSKAMKVNKVEQSDTLEGGKVVTCTHAYLHCDCGSHGQRKFYHDDDGKHCTFRTDTVVPSRNSVLEEAAHLVDLMAGEGFNDGKTFHFIAAQIRGLMS